MRIAGSPVSARNLDFGVLEGDLPPRAQGLVVEWARIDGIPY